MDAVSSEDKFEGLLLLSLWGESLVRLAGDAEEIGVHGVFRIAVSEPWLLESMEARIEPDERRLRERMLEICAETKVEAPPSWTVGAPASSLLSEAMLAATSMSGCAPRDCYRGLRGFSESERGQNRSVTAFLGTLVACAIGSDSTGVFCHYWFSETARALLDEWLERPDDDTDRAEILSLRGALQDMISLGINLRGRDEAEYLAAWDAVYRDDDYSPSHSGRAHDPIVHLRAMAGALSYAGPDLLKSFRVVAAGAGDGAATAYRLGLLAGAYNGTSRLRDFKSLDCDLGVELDRVRESAGRQLSWDVGSRVRRWARCGPGIKGMPRSS